MKMKSMNSKNTGLTLALFILLGLNMSWKSIMSQTTGSRTLASNQFVQIGNKLVEFEQKSIQLSGQEKPVNAHTVNIDKLGLTSAQVTSLRERKDLTFLGNKVVLRKSADRKAFSNAVLQVKSHSQDSSLVQTSSHVESRPRAQRVRDFDPAEERRQRRAEERERKQEEKAQARELKNKARDLLRKAGKMDEDVLDEVEDELSEAFRDVSKTNARTFRSLMRTLEKVERKLDKTRTKLSKRQRKAEHKEMLREAKAEYKEECGAATNPFEIQRALSDIRRNYSRKDYTQIASACIGQQSGLGSMSPFGNPLMNPGQQCFGDFCLPNTGFQNSMFTNNRCQGSNFGSNIGVNPMYQQNPIGCGMNFAANSMYGGGFGGSPFYQPTYGGIPIGGGGNFASTNFGSNFYGSSMIGSPTGGIPLTGNNQLMPYQSQFSNGNLLGGIRSGFGGGFMNGARSSF